MQITKLFQIHKIHFCYMDNGECIRPPIFGPNVSRTFSNTNYARFHYWLGYMMYNTFGFVFCQWKTKKGIVFASSIVWPSELQNTYERFMNIKRKISAIRVVRSKKTCHTANGNSIVSSVSLYQTFIIFYNCKARC